MNSPACGSQLERRTYDGVELDGCPACAGEWLDVGELRDLREILPLETARFAHVLRFITPSYRIRGDQAWGAY